MGLFDSLSKPFRKIIESRAAANSKSVLVGVLEEAEKWRPRGHEGISTKRRHYYEGKQEPYLRNLIVERNPIRGKDMTLTVLNYVRLIAAQESDVMAGQPTYATSVENQEEAFNAMVRTSRLTRVLKETERRVSAGRSMFLRAMYNPVMGRVNVDPFWADSVFIVPHPGAPTSTEHALAVVLKVSGSEGGAKDCYEVWTRADEMSPYEVSRIDEDGNETLILESGDGRTWPLDRHPIVAWHATMPEGAPYVDDDRDVLDVQDRINTDLTMIGEMVRFQAASAMVYEGNDDGPIYAGAGLVARVSPGEDLRVLSFDAKLTEVQNAVGELTRGLAVTRRQNPDSYATEPGPPESGVARRIKNLPQEEARAERVDMAKEMVEEHLLPLMAEVSDVFTGTSIHRPDAEYTFKPDEQPALEDEDIKQRRVLEQLAEGMLTKAQAMVALSLAETVEDAQETLDEMAAAKRPAIPPAQGGSRFGSVVLDQLNGAGRDEDSEA